MKEKIESLYIRYEELEKQIMELKKSKTVSKSYDTGREEIKNKIEEMLVKLESLEL